MSEQYALPAVLILERKAIRPRRTLMIIALENEVDVEKEANIYEKWKTIKSLKSSKSKTYQCKSGKDRNKSRHASKADDHEPIYTALVRKDN